MKSISTLALLLTATALSSLPVFAANVNDSLKVVTKTSQTAITSQKRIDSMAIQTQKMLEEYQQILRQTEYQDTYNVQLEQLKVDQEAEITLLNNQLDEINITQLRIVPLINSMADALEKFVVLDLPFRQEERVSGVILLKQQLRNPSLSVPDKYRVLLEAFQIENDYGRSVESYRDTLMVNGENLSVKFLRIGRVALYYQTLEGLTSGYWNTQERRWDTLPEKFGSSGIFVGR